LWLVISLMMVLLFNLFNKPQSAENTVSYSEFLTTVEKGEVSSVVIQGNQLSGEYLDGRKFQSYAPRDAELVGTLRQKGVKISAKPPEIRPGT
jgi:cell division protease FtsH